MQQSDAKTIEIQKSSIKILKQLMQHKRAKKQQSVQPDTNEGSRERTPGSGRGLQVTKRNKPKVVSNHFFVKQTVMNDQSHEKSKTQRGLSQLQIIADGTTIDEDPALDRAATDLRSHPIHEYFNRSKLAFEPVAELLIEETPQATFIDPRASQMRQSRLSSHTFYS